MCEVSEFQNIKTDTFIAFLNSSSELKFKHAACTNIFIDHLLMIYI